MILVMSSDYRDSCLPYPQEIINKTHHKLPIIANKRNEDLLTIIKVIYKFHSITVIAKIKEIPVITLRYIRLRHNGLQCMRSDIHILVLYNEEKSMD